MHLFELIEGNGHIYTVMLFFNYVAALSFKLTRGAYMVAVLQACLGWGWWSCHYSDSVTWIRDDWWLRGLRLKVCINQLHETLLWVHLSVRCGTTFLFAPLWGVFTSNKTTTCTGEMLMAWEMRQGHSSVHGFLKYCLHRQQSTTDADIWKVIFEGFDQKPQMSWERSPRACVTFRKTQKLDYPM